MASPPVAAGVAARGDERPAPVLVVHESADYTGAAFGDLEIADGLRLQAPSGDGGIASRTLVGSYLSPIANLPASPGEQMRAAFDRIALSFEGEVPAGTDVVLEYRTIACNEDGEGWGAWRAVAPDTRGGLTTLGGLAQRWQYRVTLVGNEAASPVVRRVTVVTQHNPRLAEQMFGSDYRAKGADTR